MNQETTKQKKSAHIRYVEPTVTNPKGKYTLEDLFSIRFQGGDKNLSKNIDKILYGI